MLARIAHQLYWVGRSLQRAEHTARMLDGVFHADLQGSPSSPAGVRLSWDSMLAIMGLHLHEGESADRDTVIGRLTLDTDSPVSVAACVASAREGARTVRDVFSADMWEAINTFHLGLQRRTAAEALRTGPYSVYAYVRERCGLFWGVTEKTMLRDEAHSFLVAGARLEAADMVLRMLRVALPTAGRDDPAAGVQDGQALALLQAAGGFQAYRRSVPLPPDALPVTRFLLYEAAYPDSVTSHISMLQAALMASGSSDRSAPLLRLRRLTADLEFRSRSEPGRDQLAITLGETQTELARVDMDIAERYFAGTAAPVLNVA